MDMDNSSLLNCLLNVMPHFVFWKDIQSRYLGCNVAFAKLLGFHHPRDIIGKTDYNLQWQPSGDIAEFFRAYDKATLKNKHLKHNHEEVLHVPNRDPITVLTNKRRLKNKGEIVGILGIALDITIRKQLEQKQNDYTQEILNLSHNLKTPITEFLGLLKLIAKSQDIKQIHTLTNELTNATKLMHTACESTLASLDATIITQSNVISIQKSLYGRFLLVEDTQLAARAIKALLKDHGNVEIDIATNAIDAVKQAKQTRYDLILMDLALSDHDGIWATQRIRIANNSVPIVALSAHLNESIKDACLNAGMQAAFSKPLTDDIINYLSQFLTPKKKG